MDTPGADLNQPAYVGGQVGPRGALKPPPTITTITIRHRRRTHIKEHSSINFSGHGAMAVSSSVRAFLLSSKASVFTQAVVNAMRSL